MTSAPAQQGDETTSDLPCSIQQYRATKQGTWGHTTLLATTDASTYSFLAFFPRVSSLFRNTHRSPRSQKLGARDAAEETKQTLGASALCDAT